MPSMPVVYLLGFCSTGASACACACALAGHICNLQRLLGFRICRGVLQVTSGLYCAVADTSSAAVCSEFKYLASVSCRKLVGWR